MSHIPTKRPETCAKAVVGGSKIDKLKEQGIVVQFQHTVSKYEHLSRFAAVIAAQAETDETVQAMIGSQALENLQAEGLRFISLALYQDLKHEEFDLRAAARTAPIIPDKG